MSAAGFFSAFTHAVDAIGRMVECETQASAANYHRKVMAAYGQVYGPLHAREVQRQMAAILDGCEALRQGADP